jgi:hypothetical protein
MQAISQQKQQGGKGERRHVCKELWQLQQQRGKAASAPCKPLFCADKARDSTPGEHGMSARYSGNVPVNCIGAAGKQQQQQQHSSMTAQGSRSRACR